MSQRRKHTMMGLAFIFGCLIIALGIYAGLKSGAPTTGNSAVAPASTDDAVATTAISGQAGNGGDWWMMGGLSSFQFATFPAPSFGGPKVPPSFKGPGRDFADYHTRISEAAVGGPNFAGHYTVVTIGCGAGCTWSVIVDNSNGHIQPFEVGGHGSGEDSTTTDIKYQLDSNLLKEVASDPADDHRCVYSAYRWTGSGLNLVGRQTAPLPQGRTSDFQGCATTSGTAAVSSEPSDAQGPGSPQAQTTPAPDTPSTPANSNDDLQASALTHDGFFNACFEKDGPAFNGIDPGEKPAMCECLYSRAQSYGTLTAENGKLALSTCKLQLATDRERFHQDYAPGDESGAGGGDGAQPQ